MSGFQTTHYKSKKNKVLLVNGIVEKHHINPEAANREVSNLQLLHTNGLAVPRVISAQNNIIMMEHIEGQTLPDMIDSYEDVTNDKYDSVTLPSLDLLSGALVHWFREYYKITYDIFGRVCGRGDVNGRNFIFDGKMFRGVDFEDDINAPEDVDIAERDIGRLMAFVLYYDPPNTAVKKQLCDAVLQSAVELLQVKEEPARMYCEQEVRAMKVRRSKYMRR